MSETILKTTVVENIDPAGPAAVDCLQVAAAESAGWNGE